MAPASAVRESFASPFNGSSKWLFRGTKGSALEGGHRVGALLRWRGATDPGSIAGDMVFVSDLYTTFARIAGNTAGIPRDRIVDGIDQTALFFKGDTHGRRDYVHLYETDKLAATLKQSLKMVKLTDSARKAWEKEERKRLEAQACEVVLSAVLEPGLNDAKVKICNHRRRCTSGVSTGFRLGRDTIA